LAGGSRGCGGTCAIASSGKESLQEEAATQIKACNILSFCRIADEFRELCTTFEYRDGESATAMW
jgi:hypothetical protein